MSLLSDKPEWTSAAPQTIPTRGSGIWAGTRDLSPRLTCAGGGGWGPARARSGTCRSPSAAAAPAAWRPLPHGPGTAPCRAALTGTTNPRSGHTPRVCVLSCHWLRAAGGAPSGGRAVRGALRAQAGSRSRSTRNGKSGRHREWKRIAPGCTLTGVNTHTYLSEQRYTIAPSVLYWAIQKDGIILKAGLKII